MRDISIVIPTFRRPALLAEAIASALADDTVSVEMIVVDDSPEGSAKETVDRFSDRCITYVRTDTPSGGNPSQVRNVGWPLARGRFVHFLDDDDRVAQGFYRAAIDAFEAHPDRGVVLGCVEPFGDDAKALIHERRYFADAARRVRFAARVPSPHCVVANLLFMNSVLVTSACMIRRECLAPLGGYDPQILVNEDVDFYSRAIRKFGWVFLDSIVLHYRISLSDSIMHGRENGERLRDTYRRMHSSYAATYGLVELLALKTLAKTVLRVS